MTDDTFSDNNAALYGGAIENDGTLTSTDDTFSGNQATLGAGIDNAGTLTATGDTFSGNEASQQGGAINNIGNALTATDDTFSDNSAQFGGAIYSFATLTATGDTFSDNSGSNGGAIENEATGTATDDTFSGNDVSVDGGAIDNLGGTLTATDDTFSANQATLGGGIDNEFFAAGVVAVAESVLASNNPADCTGPAITDDGFNIADDGSCGFSSDNGSLSDNADTDLGPLQDNGGPTQTMAIGPDSSAFELVPAVACTVSTDHAATFVRVYPERTATQGPTSTRASASPSTPTAGQAPWRPRPPTARPR